MTLLMHGAQPGSLAPQKHTPETLLLGRDRPALAGVSVRPALVGGAGYPTTAQSPCGRALLFRVVQQSPRASSPQGGHPLLCLVNKCWSAGTLALYSP